MENKMLEILLDMQKDIKNVKSELKEINNRLDKIEFKMNDGFETLELLSENNSSEVNKVKIKVSKLEKRIQEIKTIN